MFPQVSPSPFDFASLTTIAFCAPFLFMVLRIAFPGSPLDSHLYKLPGGGGGKAGKTAGRVLGKLPPTRAGCHNSPLHTKHPVMRVSLARRLSLLLLGVT